MASKVFKEPTSKIKDMYLEVDNKLKLLESNINSKINLLRTNSIETISKLDALSPLKTLSRGYTITQKDKQTIKSSKDLKIDDLVNLRFLDGDVNAKIV